MTALFGSKKKFIYLMLATFMSVESFAGVTSRVCRDVDQKNPVDCATDFLVTPTPASGGVEGRGVVTVASEASDYEGGHIFHVWYRNGQVHAKVPLNVDSGVKGYRTRSRKRLFTGFAVGQWRVAVEDASGQTLESLRFDVETAENGQLKVILSPKEEVKEEKVAEATPKPAPEAAMELVPSPGMNGNEPAPEASKVVVAQKSFELSLAVGPSGLDYQQYLVNQISQTSLEGRLSGRLNTGRSYLGFSVARTLTTNSKDAADPALRIMKGDVHAGGTLDARLGDWEIDLRVGAYGTTMNPSGFVGYDDLAGPQFSPRVRRVYGDGSSLTFYFTYAALLEKSSSLTAKNRELMSGLIYRDGRVSWTLDYGHLQYSNATTAIISKSLTGLFGIGF